MNSKGTPTALDEVLAEEKRQRVIRETAPDGVELARMVVSLCSNEHEKNSKWVVLARSILARVEEK